MTRSLAPTGSYLVSLEGAEVSYDRTVVLGEVDLRIGRGDFLGVVGPSGAGKTSLLRLVLGAVRPTRGQVRKAPGLRVGYVPQL